MTDDAEGFDGIEDNIDAVEAPSRKTVRETGDLARTLKRAGRASRITNRIQGLVRKSNHRPGSEREISDKKT